MEEWQKAGLARWRQALAEAVGKLEETAVAGTHCNATRRWSLPIPVPLPNERVEQRVLMQTET